MKISSPSISTPGSHPIDLRREIVTAFGGLELAAFRNELVAFGAAPNAMAIQPKD